MASFVSAKHEQARWASPSPVSDLDVLVALFHNVIAFQIRENFGRELWIDSHLGSQELAGKRKCFEPRAMAMGYQPSCDSLWRRMELAAAYGNHDMTHDQPVVT